MKKLEQEGIYKVRPLSWSIREAKSGAVTVSFQFLVLEEAEKVTKPEGDEWVWVTWAQYEEHDVSGDWWIIKKDGKINQGAVDQLVKSLGWDGDLSAVGRGGPPDTVVQINVKADTYRDVTRYKAAWMNPEGFSVDGGAGSVDADGVKALQGRFGSLLRAAASVAKPALITQIPHHKDESHGAGEDGDDLPPLRDDRGEDPLA